MIRTNALRRQGQAAAQGAIMLEMPFPAHRLDAVWQSLGIDQAPQVPARRLCAFARIVLVEAALKIEGPAHVGSIATCGGAAEHIDETGPTIVLSAALRWNRRRQWHDDGF